MKKLVKNIPNMITISRIISCVLGATFFTAGNLPLAIGLYSYGAISDAFDGLLARKLNAVTELGKKLDPISDKLFALSLMAPSIILGNYSMVIPLVLEGMISSINIYSETKYKKTHTEKVGKIKTIILFPTMILGLLAAKIPHFYILYLPTLIISSKYQASSMVAYYNQLQNYKKMDLENKEQQEEISKTKEEDINYNVTCKNNININSVYKQETNKTKKLIRKKDNNDRY